MNFTLPPCFRSPFLTSSNFPFHTHKALNTTTTSSRHSPSTLTPHAKFDLNELLGARGLCNGEAGIQQELAKQTPLMSNSGDDAIPISRPASTTTAVPEDAFEKELMGLTGGFPGGEKGLKLFIEKNPPPSKETRSEDGTMAKLMSEKKPRAPELPLLMPGMIALVKNPDNPYYMYCGIVQRITDGKAGVLFEGGNWDRLITFRLDELERREKCPPMKNPKSVILEELIQQKS